MQVSEQQQLSAYVLREILSGPRFRLSHPELETLDHFTLVAETILESIGRVNIGGQYNDYALSGASFAELQAFMVERAFAQIEFMGLGAVPPEAVREYADKFMRQLLRRGATGRDVEVHLFGRGRRRFVLFHERFAADGRTDVVIASHETTNALFQCLSHDITDQSVANGAILRYQLERRDFRRMLSSFQQQINIATAIGAQLKQVYNRVFFQISRTLWREHLEDLVTETREKSEVIITNDGVLGAGLAAACQAAPDDEVERVVQVDDLARKSFSLHAKIRGECSMLHSDFLERRGRLGLKPPPSVSLHDFEGEILIPLLTAPVAAVGERPFRSLLALRDIGLPLSNDPCHWVPRLMMGQTREVVPPSDPDADYESEIEIPRQVLFTDDDERDMDRDLLAFGKLKHAFRFSEFLAHLHDGKREEKMLLLAIHFVHTIFGSVSKRWSVTPVEAPPVVFGPYFTDDFDMVLIDENEGNYEPDPV